VTYRLFEAGQKSGCSQRLPLHPREQAWLRAAAAAKAAARAARKRDPRQLDLGESDRRKRRCWKGCASTL